MLIEGVEVSAAGAAALALLLQRAGQSDLAQALGLAIDGNRSIFRLRSGAERAGRTAILRALEDCPQRLAELRATMLADQIRGQALGL